MTLTSSTTILEDSILTLTRRHFLTTTGAALLTQSLAGATELTATGGPAFGASWRALLPVGVDVRAITIKLQTIVASVDLAMSPFRPESEISRFNTNASTKWIDLSSDTSTVIGHALEVAKLTNGAFDPTVGPMVGRFGFGPITQASAGRHTDLLCRPQAIKKNIPDLSVDLCGIAKGFALDRMAGKLTEKGIDSFLLEVGGEVIARGTNPKNRKWHIGIEQPKPGSVHFQRVVNLTDEALATSGDSVNSYTVGGRRYTHIIDPHNASPADNSMASVSVLAATAMHADALATALFVMGAEAGPEFAKRENLSALFVVHADNAYTEIMTGSFAQHVLI
jgi:FAD:protein FMN transferase